MVIRNRYQAHFKYPKANQFEMTFLVSGITYTDKGIPGCSGHKNTCFWHGSRRKFQVFHCTCSKVIDEKYRQFGCLLFRCQHSVIYPQFYPISEPEPALTEPAFTAPAPSKLFRRLRLRLRPKCVGSGGSGSGSLPLSY